MHWPRCPPQQHARPDEASVRTCDGCVRGWIKCDIGTISACSFGAALTPRCTIARLDYAAAFANAGFEVSVRRFGYDAFVPVPSDRRYYPKLTDAVDYPAQHKLLFRLVKRF
jgi:hypothetical protein